LDRAVAVPTVPSGQKVVFHGRPAFGLHYGKMVYKVKISAEDRAQGEIMAMTFYRASKFANPQTQILCPVDIALNLQKGHGTDSRRRASEITKSPIRPYKYSLGASVLVAFFNLPLADWPPSHQNLSAFGWTQSPNPDQGQGKEGIKTCPKAVDKF